MVSRAQRVTESTAFVGVWMVLGYVLRTDPNSYLLIGIPLTLAFQSVVRRQRIEDLWVRGGRPFPPRWVVRVAVLAAAISIALMVVLRGHVSYSLWVGAVVAGIFGVVYSLRHGTRETVRLGLHCLLATGTAGVIILTLSNGWETAGLDPGRSLEIGLVSLPAYFAVTFVLEEVSFRGAIDAHIHHAGEPYSLLSAALVSALWGIWHLPLATGALAPAIGKLLLVHVPLGVPLSYFWRRSGNLAVPAFSHAFIDALRNALIY